MGNIYLAAESHEMTSSFFSLKTNDIKFRMFCALMVNLILKGLLHGIGNLHWFLPTLGIG